MPLTAGTRLGSYEVVGLLGAGAMGEVYRGLDTKLGREVAVRILPELFALDPDRLARSEREAHVLAGASMGGGAAYNLSIKYRDRVKHVIGIFPPLNLRWLDCHCKYMRPFDPCCWGWRTDFSRRCEVVGRFYVVIAIRLRRIFDDLYDIGPETAAQVSWENPIEMIDRLSLQEGELNMYIAYGGRDQFNINAQVESFLYRAGQRGLTVAVDYDPKGKHDSRTALRMFPATVAWLAPLLAPYSPGPVRDSAAP